MRSSVPALAVSAMLLVSACNDTVPAPPAPDNLSVRSAKAAPSTPLAMSVEDSGTAVDGSRFAYRIQSDGLGEYVNGAQTITAEIDGYGNLQIGPTTASTSLARTLKFDFSAPVDLSNAYRPDETGQQLWKIKTNPNLVASQSPRITDLGINGNPASACYASTVSHQNAGTRYPAIFNTASDPQSTNVRITRTGISPATWAMVPDGTCGGSANQAALYSELVTTKSTPRTFRGYYYLPFSIRLRAL